MNVLKQEHWDALRINPSEAAFEPFYDSSRWLIWEISFRLLRNHEDALDAFQATYARLLALAREGGADAHRPVRDLVMLMAGREADALRKRRRRREHKEVGMEHLGNAL